MGGYTTFHFYTLFGKGSGSLGAVDYILYRKHEKKLLEYAGILHANRLDAEFLTRRLKVVEQAIATGFQHDADNADELIALERILGSHASSETRPVLTIVHELETDVRNLSSEAGKLKTLVETTRSKLAETEANLSSKADKLKTLIDTTRNNLAETEANWQGVSRKQQEQLREVSDSLTGTKKMVAGLSSRESSVSQVFLDGFETRLRQAEERNRVIANTVNQLHSASSSTTSTVRALEASVDEVVVSMRNHSDQLSNLELASSSTTQSLNDLGELVGAIKLSAEANTEQLSDIWLRIEDRIKSVLDVQLLDSINRKFEWIPSEHN